MTDARRTRVAIVGCGMIADQHADQLRYLPGCELTAACDTDELMARQLAERFRIPSIFTSAEEMFRAGGVEAVHITTPAQSHYSLGRLALEAGCHVYIEKPFTVNAAEADELLRMADSAGRRITVGHNLQFAPEALRVRQLVKDGFLGGPPVHMESIQCFSHGDPTYGRAVLGDPKHWVRTLPGSLLQNLISHGVSKIAEFLDGESPELVSVSFSSPYLVEHGLADVVDEVRAILRDERGTTAFFLFTTQFGAASQELRLFGRTGNLVLDRYVPDGAARHAFAAEELPALLPRASRPGARTGAECERQRPALPPKGVPNGLWHEEADGTLLPCRPRGRPRPDTSRRDPQDRADDGRDLRADAQGLAFRFQAFHRIRCDIPPRSRKHAAARCSMAAPVKHLIVSDIPTPWREPVFERVYQALGGSVEVVYFKGNEKRRLWSFKMGSHPKTVLKAITLKSGDTERFFNPGIVPFLLKRRPQVALVFACIKDPSGWLAMGLCRLLGTKVALLDDSWLGRDQDVNRMRRWARRLVYNRVGDAFVGTSRQTLNMLRHYNPAIRDEQCFLSHLVADNAHFQSRLAGRHIERRFDVMFSGRSYR